MLTRVINRSFSKVFTKNTYPELKRGNYGQITDYHLETFKKLLGTDRVVTNKDEVAPYNVDWIQTLQGESKVVLKPKTTQEVSEILKICNKDQLAVCPQGGNTGLVGGSVPVFDEIVLSMGLMNKIYDIDVIGGNIACDAGCVLQTLDEKLKEKGLMMPLDLGAKGSCQIGGNISTSAGGLRLFKYGTMQANTLGLEIVLSNGTILNLMNSLKKDNTGYHLRQLFIGSEGTLGIVTKAVIQCPVKPKSINLAFIGLKSFEDVLKVFTLAKSQLGEILSSCEMMDADCLKILTSTLNIKIPIQDCPFYMIIETHGSSENHDSEKVNQFLETGMKDLFIDGTLTNEPSRMLMLWEIRERISEAIVKKANYVFKYDLTLPHKEFYNCVIAMREHLQKFGDRLLINGFGHIGDGNLHLNIGADRYDKELCEAIEPFIFEWVSKKGGSISAEHGIGLKKAKYLKYSKSNEAIEIMRMIKKSFDPKGILNPYKVLPPGNL